jgi:hypothetical protein
MIILLAGAIAVILSLPFVSQMQADSYKALYDGRWIAQHGLPHRETLTVMAHGRSWIDQQWLAEWLFYQVWRIGGYALLACFAVGLAAAAYMILAALMSRRGASLGLVLGCTTLAVLTLSGWQFVRSQDFALPLAAGLLAICVIDHERAQPSRRLLLLPPLLVLWANLHGSVLLGAALATAYVMSRAVTAARAGQRQAAWGCAALALVTAATPLATPYGTAIIHYYREFVGNPAMARMAIEWAPPSPSSFVFFEILLPATLTLLALARAARRRQRPSRPLLAAALATGLAGALESGSIVWFGMAAAVLIADLSPSRSAQPAPAPRGILVLLSVFAILMGAFGLEQLAARGNAQYESNLPERVMTATAAYAGAHSCALILADNLSSAALLWQDPSLAGRLEYDARLEQYSPAALQHWLDFINGRSVGWTLARSGETILVGDSHYASSLVTRLERYPARSILARQSDGLAVVTGNGAEPSGRCTAPGAGRA